MARQERLRNRWLLVAALLAAAAIYVGIEWPWETKPVTVAVETLASGHVSQILAVNGRIAARNSVTVRAPVSAKALSVHADEGDHVMAGQVLLSLDTAIINTSDDYAPSRRLALDLYNDFPSLEGLAYRSRHNNGEVCYALFDRVLSSDLVELPSHLFEHNRARVDELVRLHGAILDSSAPI